MATPAVRMFRRLEGLFCVYKPSGVHWKLVRDSVETNLLKGLNATPSLPGPQEVRFLAQPGTDTETPKKLTLTVASVPVLSKHPLVTGPEFQHIQVGVGHRLDAFSSGVLVLAVGNGNKALNDFCRIRTTRDYTLEGEFGTATDDFSHLGRVVERSTYDHVTQDKLNRVLAMLQGAHQKALLMFSNVDMHSQEAYEMAARGLLGPEGKSEPILTGMRCIRFQPPNFTLEVQCINETQKFLRKVVHEVGLELRSTAVCKGVRRTRDGPFTLQDALARHQWTAYDVMQAIKQYHSSKRKKKRSISQMKKTELEQPDKETTSFQQNETDEEAVATGKVN
ncbi:pseudouridylate synthase TRUB2, mitochondrial [Echeneis naucrates]|uniref:Pseudouridine synthase II N-terminal domain-containing protein n=1 Tax=Echeneis naucrates TaxID=173247 RepID=A0A665VJF6_ECHNA|nr:mitochondrial mRNA pseudouridine synthase TRUB2 [Echeneis naucrates]XP_029358495.1 mitochondrial mRNA pseudouridine synthase TRUB2 [Echeneis naucrates]XP_029358496.1 mitochondrial mRNA pseudouridine synthase TRUB2 [Echeneis naucrates]